MIRIYLLLLLNILFSLPIYSQFQVEGKILDLLDENPISFVNIGIVNSSVGTISNENGSFSLRIPKSFKNDTVIFSALGYGKMFISVSNLSEEDFYMIYLKQAPKQLNTVTIIGESWKGKKYRIGNDNVEGSCLYADTLTAGSAIALLIKMNALKTKNHIDFPIFVRSVHLMIANNTFDEFKVRTRIYELDTVTGLPGNDILNESVITRSTLVNGRLDIDLLKYNIEINGDFYLGFEWILDKNDRRNLFLQYEGFRRDHPDKVATNYVIIDGERIPYLNYQGNLYAGPSFGISVSQRSLKNNMCFYRLNSFGRWFRSPSVLAAGVILSDQRLPTERHDLSTEITSERFEGLLPYYKIEQRPFDYRNEEFVWQIHLEDTGFFVQKMQDAIVIEIRRLENKLNFYANNNSLYPYQLEMNFSKVRNLNPIVTKESYIVYPGINKLLEFNVIDPSINNYHYELSTKEIIGDPNKKPDKAYPYLIPVGNYNNVNINEKELCESNNFINEFKLSSNDTVYAMRKGVVGAAPVTGKNVDRIYLRETLEVIHSDGTIMVYSNINPQRVFIATGEIVYPGQPLGIIGSDNKIKVELFKISRIGRLERLEVGYYTDEDKNQTYYKIQNGYTVTYPDSIIMLELNKPEVSLFNKNKLYHSSTH